MNKDYTNLKRIPKGEYRVTQNSDGSLEILISSEISKLLKITSNTEFKIQNETIKNHDVITIQSNKIIKENILYN